MTRRESKVSQNLRPARKLNIYFHVGGRTRRFPRATRWEANYWSQLSFRFGLCSSCSWRLSSHGLINMFGRRQTRLLIPGCKGSRLKFTRMRRQAGRTANKIQSSGTFRLISAPSAQSMFCSGFFFFLAVGLNRNMHISDAKLDFELSSRRNFVSCQHIFFFSFLGAVCAGQTPPPRPASRPLTFSSQLVTAAGHESTSPLFRHRAESSVGCLRDRPLEEPAESISPPREIPPSPTRNGRRPSRG